METPKIEQKYPDLQMQIRVKVKIIIYFSRCFSNISISKIKLAFGGITQHLFLHILVRQEGR
jgi:hypothetical protein